MPPSISTIFEIQPPIQVNRAGFMYTFRTKQEQPELDDLERQEELEEDQEVSA